MLLYFGGTMLMYEPSEECIKDFWKEGLVKKLPVSSSNPIFLQAAAILHESSADKLTNTDAMNEDYFRLFKRQAGPLAPFYESGYIKEHAVNGYAVTSVSEFYDSYGWRKELRPDMNDDHLGTELMFLTVLIDKYLTLDDDPCRSEMRNEIRRFVDQHLLSWLPEWHRRVHYNALTISYKGISSLIYACIEDIRSIMTGTMGIQDIGHLRN